MSDKEKLTQEHYTGSSLILLELVTGILTYFLSECKGENMYVIS